MSRSRRVWKRLWGGFVAVPLSLAAATAADPRPVALPAAHPAAITVLPNTAGAARINLSAVVATEYRDAVLKVVQSPTLSTKATAPEVVCTIAMYEWLFEHPDRVALAWQRLRVPAVPITDLGDGRFLWVDENGSEVTWRVVGTFPDGLVWYATGKVKAARATPGVPVKAVAILTRQQKAAQDGVAAFRTSVQVYVQSDSKAAALALRILGPAAPQIAEQGAEQFLEFFNGIADYVQKNPTQAEALLAPKRK
ncbi:MAG: hypothetical protein RMJ56_10725 [Gemmataceae bacterium]|nr:hypothetical protein [Gemmata sp.]MDW8198063.1 hypothetical protein [Gemmataceae bacterium]